MSRDRVLDECRRLIEADARNGRLRPLASYLRIFRGLDTEVAAEYARFAEDGARGAAGSAEVPVAGSDAIPPMQPAPAPPAVSTPPPASDAPPSPGDDVIARLRARPGAEYSDLGEIARGGMGAILRVRDDVLSRELAMKVTLDLEGADARERFVAEAKVTAHLDHPGVVPIHELGLDRQGRLYFTMKLVSGRTLGDVFATVRRGTDGWTLTRAVGLVIRVCETLAFAHSRGVVHRDVKPANVMVGDYGEVYLMDWGLAKVLGDARADADPAAGPPETPAGAAPPTAANLTLDGAVLGTPGYMAPEQVSRLLGVVDARTDVYAVGAILYELLSGSAPYAAADGTMDARSALVAQFHGPPEPLAARASGAPEELVAIAEKAISRSQDARYRDASELARDLRDYIDGRVVRAHRTGPVVELVKWVRRNRALAAAVGAAIALLAVGLATNVALLAESRRETARARREAYRAALAAASASIRDHDSTGARLRLDAARASSDGLGERAWEFRVLAARVDDTREFVPATWMQFLPDGGRRAIRMDGVLVERAPGGEERVVLDARPARVICVSPDGSHAVTDLLPGTRAAADRYRVVRTRDGASVLSARGGVEAAFCIVFHPSRPRVLVHADDGRLRLHDLELGRDVAEVQEPAPWVLTAPVVIDRVVDGAADGVAKGAPSGEERSPDGWFLVHRADFAVEVRDALTLERRAVLRGHTESSFGAICPRTGRVVTASIDDSVSAWDPDAPDTPLWTVRGARVKDPVAVAVSPDGSTVFVAPLDGTLLLLDAATGAERQVLHGPSRSEGRSTDPAAAAATFSPDGRQIATSCGSRGVAVWDAAVEGDARIVRGHAAFVYDVEFSPDGSLLASAGWDGFAGRPGAARLWDAVTFAPVAAVMDANEYSMALTWARGGRELLVHAQTDGGIPRVARIDLSAGAVRRAAPGFGCSVSLSPSKRRAVVGDVPAGPGREDFGAWSARRYRIADPETGATLVEGPELPTEYLAVSFAAETAIAADCAERVGPIRIFDPATFGERFDLVGHTGAPWFAGSDADGSRLVTGAADGTVRIWNAATGEPLKALEGHGVVAFCGEFSPDGRILATGGHDGQVRLWDTATWEELTSLHGHANYVKDVAWSRDGETLVSASGDGTIRVWSPLSTSQRAAAGAERRRIAAAWQPRIRAMLGDADGDRLGAAASAAEASIRADTSLSGRERDVALQVLLLECNERRSR